MEFFKKNTPEKKKTIEEVPQDESRRLFLRFGLLCASAALIPKEVKALDSLLDNEKSTENITEDTLTHLENNPYLKQEETEENIEIIKEVIKKFNLDHVDKVTSDISNIEQQKIAKERIKSIRFITRHELEDFTKKTGMTSPFIATVQRDEMFIALPYVRRDKNGIIDRKSLLNALIHENNHVKTTNSQDIGLGGEQVGHWSEENISRDVFEGATELMAQHITEKIDGQPSDQMYGNGEFLAAWLLEQIVGPKVLANGYFGNNLNLIRETFDKKMGTGAMNTIFHNRFSIFAKAFVGVSFPEGVVAVHEFFKQCNQINPKLAKELPSRANRDGLIEEFDYDPETKTLFHFKEIDDMPRVSNLVIEDTNPITKHSSPLRITLVHYEGVGINKLGNINSITDNIFKDTKSIEDIHDKTASELGVVDISENTEGQKLFPTLIQEYADATNVVIDISEELREYVEVYQHARTSKEKEDVKNAIKRKMIQIGNTTIRLIREKIANRQALEKK